MFTCTNERKEPFPTPLFYREGKILIFSMCLLVSVRFIGRTFGTGSNFCETIAAQIKKGHKSFRLPRPFCRTFILVSIGLTHDHEMKRDEDGDLLLRSDLVASQPHSLEIKPYAQSLLLIEFILVLIGRPTNFSYPFPTQFPTYCSLVFILVAFLYSKFLLWSR